MIVKKSPQKIPRLSTTSPAGLSDAARWQALVNRDAKVNSFVYAVTTTRIYCRPSCPARLARRANIRFYDTPSDAEWAGFRACKRCKPQDLQAVNSQVQLIQKTCEAIESQIRSGSKPTLRKLADQAGLTSSHFHRVFKKITGVTPSQYVTIMLNQNDGRSLDENGPVEDPAALQPAVVGACFDSLLTRGLDDTDIANGGSTERWNDFDVLIAAEAEWMPGPDMNGTCTLPMLEEDTVAADFTIPPDIISQIGIDAAAAPFLPPLAIKPIVS
ncbi:hypothetical protein EYZ11_006179 [Aspergillus tanneri]|uniref:HTH araC/xylS-type domain-containing protein n=1 Tax=Aspergillus tanneri TaxID=1220188 RepID=A0A4S3JGI7_9EURO|nr:uncharacterized protein ATNIH1004_009858 [Aspergillus tanneri]KAA8643096.1 hypothetical protein ATNIH1004_009858 [Aspergillus tanneri]THC94340.1 hypothetical protein EYZ11_006179 [Aspergillus tanneri]